MLPVVSFSLKGVAMVKVQATWHNTGTSKSYFASGRCLDDAFDNLNDCARLVLEDSAARNRKIFDMLEYLREPFDAGLSSGSVSELFNAEACNPCRLNLSFERV